MAKTKEAPKTEKKATGGETYKKQNQFLAIMKRLRMNTGAMIGLTVFLILVILGILAPVIAPYNYAKIDIMNANLPPSLDHLCGTDQVGRDIFSRLLIGIRYSLTLGIGATILGTAAGLVFGSIAGFFGGVVDEALMRLTDVIQSIPGQILHVAVACAIGTGYWKCIIVLAITGISGSARMIRAQIMQIRNMEYVEAASVTNCSNTKIIIKHLLPNAFSPILVSMTMGIGSTIMMAAGLAYLGLGVQPPTPEWGAMLSEGRDYLAKYPWMCIFPGVLIMITVLALNLFGDGLRDALDPKLKK
jgi:peptide/nickel transport system permease protein